MQEPEQQSVSLLGCCSELTQPLLSPRGCYPTVMCSMQPVFSSTGGHLAEPEVPGYPLRELKLKYLCIIPAICSTNIFYLIN